MSPLTRSVIIASQDFQTGCGVRGEGHIRIGHRRNSTRVRGVNPPPQAFGAVCAFAEWRKMGGKRCMWMGSAGRGRTSYGRTSIGFSERRIAILSRLLISDARVRAPSPLRSCRAGGNRRERERERRWGPLNPAGHRPEPTPVYSVLCWGARVQRSLIPRGKHSHGNGGWRACTRASDHGGCPYPNPER